MGIERLSTFIAGKEILPDLAISPRINSLDGSVSLPVSETSGVQLRSALRFGEESQKKVSLIPMAQRIEDARFLMSEYSKRSADIAWGLALFRGYIAADSEWMCNVNEAWANSLDVLAEVMFASRSGIQRLPGSNDSLQWRSKGKAALFCASTMDGPPAMVTICHAMLSGTHLILRPSWRDAVTHLAYEILYENRLAHYGQLVRWPSQSDQSRVLNKQIIANVSQFLVFSSNETFRDLIKDVAEPGTDDWDEIQRRARRYGTGLPLAIVTPHTNLDSAADELIEAARLGNGRFCLSAGPVFVMRACYSELLAKLVERSKLLKGGDPLCASSHLGCIDPTERNALIIGIKSFGGRVAYGEIHQKHMDVVILADVPQLTPCLYSEFPGTLLALIAVDNFTEVQSLALDALKKNHREAWTAVTVFGNDEEFNDIQQRLDSYRFLKTGVTARVKQLLPHQGSYFGLDLVRRSTVELNDLKVLNCDNLKEASL
ncbi:MAG: aldehyde dehydrogenase family protein [Chitinophagaceae bacterium]|nr:aldehyde dehydrogenase family protein [Oligoflexus sp.]